MFLIPTDYDAIIVNAAGCGAMLKDYGHLLQGADHEAAKRFVAKVKDISEFLWQLGPIPPRHSVPMKVTYHDACHLCHAQQVRSQPRALLMMIPGLDLVPLEESEICCGAAGTYNLTQPEMSERLGKRKLGHLMMTGAEVVATGNVGCILQIEKQVRTSGSEMKVVHPIDLLDRAYRGELPGSAFEPGPLEAWRGPARELVRPGSGIDPLAWLREEAAERAAQGAGSAAGGIR